eukprot:TRINITY_DN5317_c1_g1_i2.p1 TRINITY_DN5317_c1_g1~~TRINITY_DN5317_c1_g1_i2.p1  ORF type:complete len:287 (-),score=1.21 TRINITY_DN5317_c1_g1_i2:2173-3033(-)
MVAQDSSVEAMEKSKQKIRVVINRLEAKLKINRNKFYDKLIQTEFSSNKQKQGTTIIEILLMLLMPLLEGLSIVDTAVRLLKYFAVICSIFLCFFLVTGIQQTTLFYFFKCILLTVCCGGGIYFGSLVIRGVGNYSGFTKIKYVCVGFLGDGSICQISKISEKKVAQELMFWRNIALDLCLFQLLSEYIDVYRFHKQNDIYFHHITSIVNTVESKNCDTVLNQSNRGMIMQFISCGKLHVNNIPNQWFFIDCNSCSSGWNRLRQRVEFGQKEKIDKMIQQIQNSSQ